MPARELVEATSTGDVVTQVPAIVHSVSLAADSAAGKLLVKDGSGGTTLLTLQAGANSTASHTFGEGVQFVSAVHATLTGSGAVASFEVS